MTTPPAQADDGITGQIAAGEALIQADDPAAVAFHEALAARYPTDGRVAFAHAGALDSAGREDEAIVAYRHALILGLPDELRSRMVVQMGSTMRNVGDLDGAVALLETGVADFPDDIAMACFLALARHSAGQPGAAVAGLIRAILRADETGVIHLPRYQRSLRVYAADLVGEDAS